MELEKVECNECDTLILPKTYDKCGGLCMPCYMKNNEGNRPREMMSEEIKNPLQEKLDGFYSYCDLGYVTQLDFTSPDYTIPQLIKELSTFFDVQIEKRESNEFYVSGKCYKLPLTGTHYDNQVITASIYNLLSDTTNIYISSDGNWLYKIDDEQMVSLESKYDEALKHKAKGDMYKTLDKFNTGSCAYTLGIKYPCIGSETTIEEFLIKYKEDEEEHDNLMNNLASLTRESFDKPTKRRFDFLRLILSKIKI